MNEPVITTYKRPVQPVNPESSGRNNYLHMIAQWWLLKRFIRRISGNGVRAEYDAELQTSILLANWVSIGYMLMTLPFVWLFSESKPAVFMCVGTIAVYLFSMWLLHKGKHQVARLMIANLCPVTIYTISALVYINEADSALSAKVLMLGGIIIPLVIFRFNERLQIMLSVLLIFALIVTMNYANAHAPFKIMDEDINTAGLQILCFIEAIIFIVVFVSYYKYTHNQSTERIQQLLQDVTSQNERMIEAHAELTESEQRLKDLNESKNKLFSIIAHDLRAPLNSFKGFSGLLSSHIHNLSKEDIDTLVKGMYKSFHNVNTLLENLLNWARAQMNMFSFRAETFSVDTLVSENISLLEKAAQDKNISLVKQSSSELFAVMDVNAFNIVLRNLISNAIKFTRRGGQVEIRTFRQDDFVRVEIADNGIGMSDQIKQKLFRLDTQSTSLGTANERGTGLGLILCKEFIEKSGGTIGVESEKDKGSTFFFTVPAYTADLFQ